MRYPWGNTITHNQANYWSTEYFSFDISQTRGFNPAYTSGGRPYTSPVASFSPNGYGLFDMAGNVWEWCYDCAEHYPNYPVANPTGANIQSYHIARGGAWSHNAMFGARVATRNQTEDLDYWDAGFGFRTVISGNEPNNLGNIPPPEKPRYSSLPPRQSGKDSLFLVTHGWQEPWTASDPVWIDDMTNRVCKYLSRNGIHNWQVVAYRWIENATVNIRYGGPETALYNAEAEGYNLAKDIVRDNWTRVHLVGFSSGGALIQGATWVIKMYRPNVVVHLTFLDAFTGFNYGGKSRYGLFANWSENYFSHDGFTGGEIFSLTEGIFEYSYNVDVTGLDPHKDPIIVFNSGVGQNCESVVSSHSWPHEFYANTIPTNSVLGSEGFGFPLSYEGGGWSYALSHYNFQGNNPHVLGNTSPVCSPLHQNYSRVNYGNSLNLISIPILRSSSGATYGTSTINLSTPVINLFEKSEIPSQTSLTSVWLTAVVEATSKSDFVSFDVRFLNGTNSYGLLTVYANTNQIGRIDERSVYPEMPYSYPMPAVSVGDIVYLGFRLDSFSTNSSSVLISNICLGKFGAETPSRLTSLHRDSDGRTFLRLHSPSNCTFLIQSSTNLSDWIPSALIVNTNSFADFYDDKKRCNSVFYRAISY